MGFDDFYENKRRYQGNSRAQIYHNDNKYSSDSHNSYHGNVEHLKWLNIPDKIRSNKKLKLLVLLAGILILAIAIVLIIVLLPLIMKIINYISQNGLQGLLDNITGFLDKIWNGSSK
jgi:hypothetical protein